MVRKKEASKKKVNLGEILSVSLNKSRDNFPKLFSVGLKYYFLPFLVLSLIGVLTFGEKFYILAEDELPTLAHSIFSSLNGILMFVLGLFFSIYLIYFFAGKQGKIVGTSWGRVLGALGFVIVFCLVMVGLFVLLVLPGIIFGIFWVLAFTIFILEEKSIFSAMGKSFDMIRGRWWKTLGYLVVLVLVIILLMLPFGIIFYFVDGFFSSGWVLNSWLYVRGAISFFVDLLISIFSTAFLVEYYMRLKDSKK